MQGPKLKYRYDHYTWPEMKAVIARQPQPVCILPVGSVEDHGRHLPLDVDNFLIGSICEEAARREPDLVLLLPGVPARRQSTAWPRKLGPGSMSLTPCGIPDSPALGEVLRFPVEMRAEFVRALVSSRAAG